MINSGIIKLLFTHIADIKDIYKLIRLNKLCLKCYRETNVMVFCNKAKNKKEKLAIFISYYKYLPKQGSIEWLMSRTGSEVLPPIIGGSEIKKMLTSPRSVAEAKLGVSNFNGSIHTRWGNLFEEIFGMVIDLLFKSKSEETGSIPGYKNKKGQTIQSYSPDRLLVTNINQMLKIMLNDKNDAVKEFGDILTSFANGSDMEVIMLCEFKCPSVRIPDGKIPDEYKMQPPLGAVTIPIVDICMFANNSIRKCSVSDFKLNNKYDKMFHEKDPDGCFGEPMFIGFLGVYKSVGKSSLIQSEEITKQLMLQQLDQYMKNQVESADTDYHQLELKMSNIASLTNLCLDFVDNDNIIAEYLIDKLKPTDGYADLLRDIIRDIINLRNKKEKYHLQYGDDFGDFTHQEFDDVLKNVMESRFTATGYKTYYDAGFAVNKSAADSFEISENVVSSDADCHVWLNKKVTEFVKYCKVNGCKPIGIVPWKMFKLSMIPVLKDENFLEPYKEKLENFADGVQSIKEKAKKLGITRDKIIEFYTTELDVIYGVKKQYKRQVRSPSPSKYDTETVDYFNNI